MCRQLSRCTFGLDSLVRLPDYPFGNLKRLVLRLRLAHRLLPPRGGWPPNEPEQPARFAPPALPGFLATTSQSARVPRIGTLPLAVSAARGSPFDDRAGSPSPTIFIEATGSHVPQQSLSQARATSMPYATWAISRSSRRPIPRVELPLGFGVIFHFSDTCNFDRFHLRQRKARRDRPQLAASPQGVVGAVGALSPQQGDTDGDCACLTVNDVGKAVCARSACTI